MGGLDVERLVERLLRGEGGGARAEWLREEELAELCFRSRELLMSESALVEVPAPLVVAGDVHGQYTDLLRLFAAHGVPPTTRWLFLGDYVDRGPNSIEVISLLLGLKLRHPQRIFLLRGNHETSAVNKAYGFLAECRQRFSLQLYKLFSDVFNCLPVAALAGGGRILAMHGGISEKLRSWDQIRRLERPSEVPDKGLLCDLLWSDPDPEARPGFHAGARGVGSVFGPEALEAFCARMDLDLVARAHQVVQNGYEFYGPNLRCVTIFSAPNYCGDFDNAAAVMLVGADLRCTFSTFKPVFSASKRPPL